jgi:hypothetical protein
VPAMTTVVSAKRVSGARSTWLTAAAGLLLLVTAVVMMVSAAPQVHAGRHGTAPSSQLVSWSWVTRGHPALEPVAHIPNGVRP